jgi:hypothetical protein
VAHRREHGKRRGLAVVLVLALLGASLAVAYGVLKSEATTLALQQNFGSRDAARQAALSGLAIGLRHMHTSSWGGVETSLSRNLGNGTSCTVKYTAGDPNLQPGHPDYNRYPFRVTLDVTGYAIQSYTPLRMAWHQLQAVVELVPRALSTPPGDWSRMQNYVFFQTHAEPTTVEIPFRIAGAVRLQKDLKIADAYPDKSTPRTKYLTDLNAMRLTGQGDFRPFNGPLELPTAAQSSATMTRLTELGVTVVNRSAAVVGSDWQKPALPPTYRLYPGGPPYQPTVVGTKLNNVTLQADPLTNPLGLFYCSSSMRLQGDVMLRGTLVCDSDITLQGAGLSLAAVDLPSLDGTAGVLRLPTLSVGQHLKVEPGCRGTLTGLAAIFNELRVTNGLDTAQLAMTGRLIVRQLKAEPRKPWEDQDWNRLHDEYLIEWFLKPLSTPRFPIWLRDKYGLDPQPRVFLQADPQTVTYHWLSLQQPLYVAAPGDAGLRWSLLAFQDVSFSQ